MKKKPLVIYHGNCADGFGAAWCFHNADDSDYEFHAGVYGKPPPDCTDRTVYMVDFSYKKEVVKQICKDAFFVYFIDHHITAINDLAPLSDRSNVEFQHNFMAITDVNKSGAMLAWDFLHNGLAFDDAIKVSSPLYMAPPVLLDHIQDRDLWKFKLPNTREISAALFSYEYSFELWDELMSSKVAGLLNLASAGAAIERKHFKDIKELLAVTQRIMHIDGNRIPVANLPYTLSSDAGTIMAKEYESGTAFAACYWDTPEHRVFSLRSAENGLDVSEIAARYGGGGHKHAAGFSVPRTHILASL